MLGQSRCGIDDDDEMRDKNEGMTRDCLKLAEDILSVFSEGDNRGREHKLSIFAEDILSIRDTALANDALSRFLKEFILVEELLGEGNVQVLVSTATLAKGVWFKLVQNEFEVYAPWDMDT